MATHIETYLDCLKTLPNDFQRTFALLKELEERTVVVNAKLESEQKKCLKCAENPGEEGDPTPEMLGSVRRLQWEAYNYSQEKVALVDQADKMIHAFINRLDSNLALFEEELGPDVPQDFFDPPPAPPRPRAPGSKRPEEAERPIEDTSSDSSDDEKPAPKRRNNKAIKAGERSYCVCKQAYAGEMIGCDNDKCPHQWFHMACVGMSRPPEGQWYCQECAEKRSRYR